MERLKNIALGSVVIILALLAICLCAYAVVMVGAYLIACGIPIVLAFSVPAATIGLILIFVNMSENIGKAIRRKL